MGMNTNDNKILESNCSSKPLPCFNVADCMFFVWKISSEWQVLWAICSQINCGVYWISHKALLFTGARAKVEVLMGSTRHKHIPAEIK